MKVYEFFGAVILVTMLSLIAMLRFIGLALDTLFDGLAFAVGEIVISVILAGQAVRRIAGCSCAITPGNRVVIVTWRQCAPAWSTGRVKDICINERTQESEYRVQVGQTMYWLPSTAIVKTGE